MLKKLPTKELRYFIILTNAIFRVGYFIIITLLKPGKSPNVPQSYRPTSLLPIISKVTEKVIHKRIITIVNDKELIPNRRFGF